MTDAKLGKNVVDREITDETTTFAVGEKAYLWLRVEGGTGETLTVVWKINDLEFPVDLSIGGSPWRTWATKTLHLAGDWSVTVYRYRRQHPQRSHSDSSVAIACRLWPVHLPPARAAVTTRSGFVPAHGKPVTGERKAKSDTPAGACEGEG